MTNATIRKACIRALEEYPLHIKALHDAKQAVYADYEGGNRWISLDDTKTGGGSIHKSKLSNAGESLTSGDIKHIENQLQIIDDVMALCSDQEKALIKCRFWNAMSIAGTLEYLGYTAETYKTYYRLEDRIIRLLAARIGLCYKQEYDYDYDTNRPK